MTAGMGDRYVDLVCDVVDDLEQQAGGSPAEGRIRVEKKRPARRETSLAKEAK